MAPARNYRRERRAYSSCFCILLILALGDGTLAAGTLAQFRTSLGDIDVELFHRDKPVTVRNFVRYAQTDSYAAGFVHRWVPGFVIQGGGFRTARQAGQTVIEPIPSFARIENEYGAGRTFSNTYGTIAMARVGGITNSATSQWFFNLGNNAPLDAVDGGFTVFGRVLRGTNVLNRFNIVSQTNSIYRLPLDPPLSELPVLSPAPTLNDLIYVQVLLLRLELRIAEGGKRLVSWISIKDQLNHLEAAPGPNAAWQTLLSIQGTGDRFEFADNDLPGNSRFYRVRVDY